MPASHVTVIAEAGVNHNGDPALARALVDAAAEAGADAVKFQTFSAERLAAAGAGMADYQKRNLGRSEPQVEMLRRLELGRDHHHMLLAHCAGRNIRFLSSPFDMESLRFLVDELALPVLKVPSGEITNGPFLYEIGRSGRDAIVSTGMSDMEEIATALDVLAWGYLGRAEPRQVADVAGTHRTGEGAAALREKVTLLQCTSEYPAPLDQINLRAMATLGEAFGLATGFSDHSQGIAVPVAAAALGARIIEKHFTLDRTLPGPDHRASLEPDELKDMVAGIRAVELALGSKEKGPFGAERETMKIARKTVVAARRIRSGAVIGRDDITAMRAGPGRSPMESWQLVGTVAGRDYEPGEVIE